jgi:hydrogenase maturation protease
MSNSEKTTLVVGLGNPLMGDDGVGLAALERLREEYAVPPEVQLIDGGTWGMNLLPVLEGAKDIIFLDAIRIGSPPGTIVELEQDQLPRILSHKMSPHQIDLREVLALAMLRGNMPDQIAAIGVEPEHVEMTMEISQPVMSAIDEIVSRTVARLAAHGHHCRPHAKAACTN